VEASVAVAGAHLKTSPRTKIKVEQMPQDALRCGLSGVTSFVRSNVAEVVYANYPRRHRQVTAGIIYLTKGSVNALFHDEVLIVQSGDRMTLADSYRIACVQLLTDYLR
jgi:hypothetical protein